MVAAALALALLARPAAPAAPAPFPALRVLVRIDTRTAGQHVGLHELMDTVRAIWRPCADIVFADVTDSVEDGFDDQLQLVISERPGSAAPGGSAIGWITFVTPGRPEQFVTVSVATAHALLARDSWMGRRFDLLPPALRRQFVTRAVSWSVAHEIGHYLLRTSAHSAGGLMKATLTAEEVMRNDHEWIQLEAHDVEVLRLRAARPDLVTKLRLEPPRDEP
jgi:hypothetical protein